MAAGKGGVECCGRRHRGAPDVGWPAVPHLLHAVVDQASYGLLAHWAKNLVCQL